MEESKEHEGDFQGNLLSKCRLGSTEARADVNLLQDR